MTREEFLALKEGDELTHPIQINSNVTYHLIVSFLYVAEGIISCNNGLCFRYESCEVKISQDILVKYLTSDLFPEHTTDEKCKEIRRQIFSNLEIPSYAEIQHICSLSRVNYSEIIERIKILNR